jgi:mycothiol synthase
MPDRLASLPGVPPTPAVARVSSLSPDQVREIRSLVAAAEETDGVAPLSEQVLLHVRPQAEIGLRHLLVTAGNGRPGLLGYAQLDSGSGSDGGGPGGGPGSTGVSAELVVAPDERRRGIGTTLVRAVLADTAGGPVRIWAHGEHPGAGRLAETQGFVRSRELWQMRRALDDSLPEPRFPLEIRVRTFVPGEDEQAWLDLNRRAFATHPEQGRWTLEDLQLREEEPWFDPAGFFLAERDGQQPTLVGFHWTKVHPAGGGVDGRDPIGEVYVVGVAPEAAAQGLGSALTVAGLVHLRSRGLAEVLLYVDADNAPAVAVYTRLGFRRHDVDVTYVHV